MTVGHPAEPWLALAGQPLLIKNLENNFLCRMKPFHVFNSEKSPFTLPFVSFFGPHCSQVFILPFHSDTIQYIATCRQSS